jgi:uncharacterized membrane protein
MINEPFKERVADVCPFVAIIAFRGLFMLCGLLISNLNIENKEIFEVCHMRHVIYTFIAALWGEEYLRAYISDLQRVAR